LPELVDAEGNVVREEPRVESRRRVYTMAIENIQYVPVRKGREEQRISADSGNADTRRRMTW